MDGQGTEAADMMFDVRKQVLGACESVVLLGIADVVWTGAINVENLIPREVTRTGMEVEKKAGVR